MRRATFWFLPGLICLNACAALAQQNVPPPNPNDNGPTLAATMQFIQDKMNNKGAQLDQLLPYLGSPSKGMFEVTADPNTCQLKIKVSYDNDPAFPIFTIVASFRDIQKIVVAPSYDDPSQSEFPPESYLQIEAERALFKIRSEVLVDSKGKMLKKPRNGVDDSIADFNLIFRGADMADRVAKAMVHAVELCGGGSKPEPF